MGKSLGRESNFEEVCFEPGTIWKSLSDTTIPSVVVSGLLKRRWVSNGGNNQKMKLGFVER